MARISGASSGLVANKDGTNIGGSSGGLTDAELRATPVLVSGTFWQTTQPVSATDFDIRNLTSVADSVTADTEFPAAALLTTNLATPTTTTVASFLYGRNSVDGNWEFVNTLDHNFKVTSGPIAAGLIAEFDDTSPTTVTENQFSPLRLSLERSLYTEIRDAAGNERGLNIDVNGAVGVTGTFWQAT